MHTNNCLQRRLRNLLVRLVFAPPMWLLGPVTALRLLTTGRRPSAGQAALLAVPVAGAIGTQLLPNSGRIDAATAAVMVGSGAVNGIGEELPVARNVRVSIHSPFRPGGDLVAAWVLGVALRAAAHSAFIHGPRTIRCRISAGRCSFDDGRVASRRSAVCDRGTHLDRRMWRYGSQIPSGQIMVVQEEVARRPSSLLPLTTSLRQPYPNYDDSANTTLIRIPLAVTRRAARPPRPMDGRDGLADGPWPAYSSDLHYKRVPRKRPRPDQRAAINAVAQRL